MVNNRTVLFVDLQSQYKEIKAGAERAMKDLLKRGDFILGKDVADFEVSFARYCGAKFAIGVNSGTDALFLGLLSLGVGPGDEVIVPAFTYIASAFAVTYTGARPVFVDVDEKTFNIDPVLIEKAVTFRTKAIMPVHLYGQAADMGAIHSIVTKHRLKVIEDAAQAHGTEYKGRRAGSLGDVAAFSFYPTKNLGGLGDGGMVMTDNPGIFERLKKLRDYGRKSKYEHSSVGYNSRLDSLQAIYLKEKLKKLDQWNEKRARVAGLYSEKLRGVAGVRLPIDAGYGKHAYHIYAVRVENRDRVLERLKKAGVQAAVHYPVPLHLQDVYAQLGFKPGDFPAAEAICRDVLCLPIYPHMTQSAIGAVVGALKKATEMR